MPVAFSCHAMAIRLLICPFVLLLLQSRYDKLLQMDGDKLYKLREYMRYVEFMRYRVPDLLVALASI